MPPIKMYSSHYCPYCSRAELLLKRKGVQHIDKILIDEEPDALHTMIQITGRRTVPQIFIGSQHIGGYDDLAALDRAGELDPLLTD